MFINRKDELNHLEEEYQKDSPRFVIIFGRRRIGKTALIEKFGKNKENFIYYLADQQTQTLQIESFKTQINQYANDEILNRMQFETWDQLFGYLSKTLPADERMILAIDEVTYLIKSTPAFPSILQKYWDTFFSKTKIFLILSGSLVGMMLRDVLDYSSPLYGRRTSQIHLKEFNFKQSSQFLQRFDIKERVLLYSITGGVAKYLLMVEENNVQDFIKKKIIQKEGFFYLESIFLLSQEFKNPNVYLSILKGIALGHTKLGEISNFVGIEGKKLTRYLDVLQEIGLVIRQVPVTKNPQRFRKSVYQIEDNFLNFWFRFVFPNRSSIELRDTKDLLNNIMNLMPGYASLTFEQISMEFLREMDAIGRLNVHFTKWGKWWDRENEIDVVAINNETFDILFCECKWQNRKTGVNIIEQLVDKAQLVQWFNEKRKDHFIIISKSGFTKKAVEFAQQKRVLLFEIDDINAWSITD